MEILLYVGVFILCMAFIYAVLKLIGIALSHEQDSKKDLEESAYQTAQQVTCDRRIIEIRNEMQKR